MMKQSGLREMKAEYGVMARSDGSCRLYQGGTCVLAAVFGPVLAKYRSEEKIDEAAINVNVSSYCNSGYGGDLQEKEMEMMVRNMLEPVVLRHLYPRCVITVVIQVVCDDGGLLSTCINAACLALLDAGIDMKGIVSSVTIALTPSNDILQNDSGEEDTINSNYEFVIDPTGKLESKANAIVVCGYNNVEEGISLSHITGCVGDIKNLIKAFNLSQDGCKKIFEFYRTVVSTKNERTKLLNLFNNNTNNN